MNHFLSRIGRSTFGRHFMPTLSCATFAGYLGFHTISHDLIRKLFVAQGPDGRPAQISDYLRDIITEVFGEVEQAGFHVDVFKLKNFTCPQPVIRWFASSTLDPIVYGMTDFATGVSIGVPNSYNYQKPDDLPDSVFVVKKLAIVRSPQGREREQQDQQQQIADDEVMLEKREREPTVLVRKIDKNSEEGQEYIDSLLLSEKAKRFSIARELYVADSYRPLLHSIVVALAPTAAITTSRAYVHAFKLKDHHISHRLPGYFLAGVLGYGVYTLLSDAIEEYIAKKANGRAKAMGENYVAGAEEYFKKQAIRDRILGIASKKIM